MAALYYRFIWTSRMDLIRNLLPGEITFAISLARLIYQKGFARERFVEQLCCRPPGIPPPPLSISLSLYLSISLSLSLSLRAP